MRRLPLFLIPVVAAFVGVSTATAAQTITANCDAAGFAQVLASPGETLTITVTGTACTAFVSQTGQVASATVTFSDGSTMTTPISNSGVDTYQQVSGSGWLSITQVVVVLPSPIASGTSFALRTPLGAGPGVYANIAVREGTPTPPAPEPTTTPAPVAPAPVTPLELPVADIPAALSVDVGGSTSGALAPNQPITVSVPCTAPEGTTLSSCTVNITAPQTVLLGQGDGVRVRADKRVSIGKATVRAKGGRKTIIVKVRINQTGRKALQRNMKITAKVGLEAVTIANQSSTGETTTEMQLPTQLISPQAGIFDSGSTTLNKAGVAFVNRLAKLLPEEPKRMVFIGFTDITGVPGDNRWIADRRAKAVRDALEAKGVEAARSSIEVKAARSPRDDNATDQGRERNRRVSIRITY